MAGFHVYLYSYLLRLPFLLVGPFFGSWMGLGLVCNILSLEWLTNEVLFSEVSGLGCYVLSLDQLLTW